MLKIGDRVENIHNERILQITKVEEVPTTSGGMATLYTLSNGAAWEESRLFRHWKVLERTSSRVMEAETDGRASA